MKCLNCDGGSPARTGQRMGRFSLCAACCVAGDRLKVSDKRIALWKEGELVGGAAQMAREKRGS